MKVFRSAIAMFAGLGAFLLAPAAAQAADYQVYRDAVCTPNAQCGINFPPVPAGKTLRIDHVSCYVRFLDVNEVSAAQLVVVNSAGARVFATTLNLQFQDDPEIGATSQRVYASNDSIRAVARPTQFFRAYAQVHNGDTGNVATILQLSCGISGTITP